MTTKPQKTKCVPEFKKQTLQSVRMGLQKSHKLIPPRKLQCLLKELRKVWRQDPKHIQNDIKLSER